MRAFKTNAKAELSDIIEELIEDICEKAEQVRDRDSIERKE